MVENAAANGTFTLVVPPIEFAVRATYGDSVVEVSQFSAYVERTIAIPDGVDPDRITTGVVVDPDGSVRHVPTKVILIDGKYFAVINSLTNSTYTVIWHPKTFSDVEGHWSRDDVNEMGSRLVIQGIDDARFEPDRSITRAEFAAVITRALGLHRPAGTGGVTFADVKPGDWYDDAVRIAASYGLIAGYGDGTFRPDRTISREEAMAVLARAMKLANLDTVQGDSEAAELLGAFADHQAISGWAREAAASAVKQGIAQGSNGKLAPKETITRAETAAMIVRLLRKANLI